MRWIRRLLASHASQRGGQARVLLVCAANLCRSPMALQVLRTLHARAGAAQPALHCESAGLVASARAERPDARAQAVLQRHGYGIAEGRSRRVQAEDFARFDLVLAMDAGVLAELAQMCPPGHAGKLHLFLDFAPAHAGTDVPDPYWGDARGFEHVLELCTAGARGVLAALAARAGPADAAPAPRAFVKT